jgi:hypothetical protein
MEADRVLSHTQLAALTGTAQLLCDDEGAKLGRSIAERASVIALLPEGSAEHQAAVEAQIAAVNFLLNSIGYPTTVQHRIDYLMEGEPEPKRPAEPNDTTPGPEVWRSAKGRYDEQTALAHGLWEACAPVLGRTRAAGFAMELLLLREGDQVKMLHPAQTRVSANDSSFRASLKQLAVQRQAFDAVAENVPRAEILRRANGKDAADLISPKTFENWVAGTENSDIALAEQLGLASRNGTITELPLALWVRWLQLCEKSFAEWLHLALNER